MKVQVHLSAFAEFLLHGSNFTFEALLGMLEAHLGCLSSALEACLMCIKNTQWTKCAPITPKTGLKPCLKIAHKRAPTAFQMFPEKATNTKSCQTRFQCTQNGFQIVFEKFFGTPTERPANKRWKHGSNCALFVIFIEIELVI